MVADGVVGDAEMETAVNLLNTSSRDSRNINAPTIHNATYDHRHRKTRDPVRSPIDKACDRQMVNGRAPMETSA
jgi:hypothetical protein